MAKDADGNYYYDAGTVNELFDNVAVTEDADGNLSMTVSGSEMRVQEFAHLFGGERADPTSSEMESGEVMLFVGDGSGTATAGQLAAASYDGSTVTVVDITTGL